MTSDSPIHEGRKRQPGAAVVEPSPFTLTNLRADAPSFVFIADESPLHRKLGVYETR